MSCPPCGNYGSLYRPNPCAQPTAARCNPCNLPLVYLGPGLGGTGFPVAPVTPPVPPTPANGIFLNSASPAGYSLDIASGGGAIPEGFVTLPVAGTATIVPLFPSAPTAGLTVEGVAPGTQGSLVRVAAAGQYDYDFNVCFAPVAGVPTSADFRVAYIYAISATGINRQLRVVSVPAVGSATPTCMEVSGSSYLEAGDRVYFAVRQTNVGGTIVPITVTRMSVRAA